MLLSLCRPNALACELEFGSQFVFASQRAQFVPGCVFDGDARHLALLLPDVFDLARIEYATGAFGRRRCFQISGELGDFLLKSFSGRNAATLNTAMKQPSLCRPVGSTPKPKPVSSPHSTSTIAAKPEPLYPSVPPSGSSAPPLRNCLGSVVCRPSLSMIQPVGISSPRAAASWIFPAATADVAMSR